jgi:hypothetical protein
MKDIIELNFSFYDQFLMPHNVEHSLIGNQCKSARTIKSNAQKQQRIKDLTLRSFVNYL